MDDVHKKSVVFQSEMFRVIRKDFDYIGDAYAYMTERKDGCDALGKQRWRDAKGDDGSELIHAMMREIERLREGQL
jgi:hypothetical protein